MGFSFTFLTILLAAVGFTNSQQVFMEYIERRLAVLEDRIALWHEQSSRYSTELRDFKNKVVSLMESVEKEREQLRAELENTNIRVDRVEREMDYLETQNPAPPCVEMEEKLVDHKVTIVKEKKKEKYEKLTECTDMIASIKSMKILKRIGSSTGMWARDPLGDSDNIYVLEGTGNDTVYEYSRARDFTQSPVMRARRIKVPYPWLGTGHVVYGGFLYYVTRKNEYQIIKFDLKNKTVVDSAVFPAEQQIPVYSLSPFNYIDIVADEEGLWAIYATNENEKNICLAKLDPKTLDIEQMWDTPCPRENAESAFVICGAVYVVYNTKLPSRSRVQCVFDVRDAVSNEEAPLVYFPKRYASHSSMKYNPKEKQIYAWDDGYQLIYRLVMKKKDL
uniref:Olfactomedin like 3 n=3 Tax=Latimeria chalumnae TaxID=7897 RepID=H3BFC4_LATCH